MSSKNSKLSRNILNITLVVIFTFPKLNFNIAGIPFYIVDLLILINWFFLQTNTFNRIEKSVAFIIVPMIFFVVISEFFAYFILDYSIEPFYTLIRTLIIYSLLFLLYRRISNRDDFYRSFLWVVRFSVITVLLVTLSSLPATRDIITKNVFEISFLDPAKGFLDKWDRHGDVEDLIRGRSLIGVSIISGYYLTFIYAICLLLLKLSKRAFDKISLNIIRFLIIFGVLFTNSRGPIITLSVLLIIEFIYLNVINKVTALIQLLLLLFVLSSFYSSDDINYFFNRSIVGFAKLSNTEEGLGDSENERLYAYIEPFEVIQRNSFLVFFGLGVSDRNIIDYQGRNLSDHAVFASAIYSYGLIFALLFFVLLFVLSLRIFISYSGFQVNLLQIFIVIFIWQLLGHAIISETRGLTILVVSIFLISSGLFQKSSQNLT